MKASMDEKLNLVFTLKDTIKRARRIIDNANLYCYLVTNCGWKPDYIWEILNSSVKDAIAEGIINNLYGRTKQEFTDSIYSDK